MLYIIYCSDSLMLQHFSGPSVGVCYLGHYQNLRLGVTSVQMFGGLL